MKRLLISIADYLVDWGKKCPPGYLIGLTAHHAIEAINRRIDRALDGYNWAKANDPRGRID